MGRIFRNPTLRAATQATFVQRLVAFTAMVVMVSAVLFWPQLRDGVGVAVAQTQDNNYQPFSCGQTNSAVLQQRRANLTLKNGTGAASSAKAYPCISGVQWQLKVGCTMCPATNTATGNSVVAILNNAFSSTGQTLFFAGNGSAGGLTQVSIQGLQFCTGAGVPAQNVNGWSCRKPVNGVQLFANSASSGSYKPLTNYQLNISPASAFTIGGQGMMADIWGTGSSQFEVPLDVVPLGGTGCTTIGGSTSTNACTVSLADFSGSLAQSLAGGTTMPLIGVNLSFYYLISHTPGATNPYTELATTNSVILPNTRIFVGNGS